MPISNNDIYEFCRVIAEQRQLKVCVKEAAKAGMITGGVTFASALILGPLVIVPAALAGGLLAHKTCNRYVPLYQILSDMSEDDKQKLCDHMRSIINSLDIGDAVTLMAIVTAAQSDGVSYGRMLTGMGTYFQQSW